MANSFKMHCRQKHYSFKELYAQVMKIKNSYSEVSFKINKRKIECLICIKPTDDSISYKLKIVGKIESTTVNIFPVEPYIGRVVDGKKVPHMYRDGSLCLFYPENNEWNFNDSWSNTLVPWASLWLYYYEIWIQTGEWVGGGIHPGEKKSFD